EAVGDNGFAPTAAVVHPVTGDLYISIGGRGTRGAVYRIRYPNGIHALDPAALSALRVQPSPSTWHPQSARELLEMSTSTDSLNRLRALVQIRRFRPQFTLRTCSEQCSRIGII